jgi:hypothetical protein
MTITLGSHSYWGIPPEELHEAMRRARAERAEVVHQMFTGLVSWRRKLAKHAAAEKFNPAHVLLPPYF